MKRMRLTIEIDTTLKGEQFKTVAMFTAQRLAESIRGELVYCATEAVKGTRELANKRA